MTSFCHMASNAGAPHPVGPCGPRQDFHAEADLSLLDIAIENCSNFVKYLPVPWSKPSEERRPFIQVITGMLEVCNKAMKSSTKLTLVRDQTKRSYNWLPFYSKSITAFSNDSMRSACNANK